MTASALLAAVAVDLAVGDPRTRWHPVRAVGRCIETAERILRAIGADGRGGGIMLVVGTMAISAAPVVGLMMAVMNSHLKFVLDVVVIYFSIALGSLLGEGKVIAEALNRRDTAAGREGVARICGRDVQALNESDLTRATIESLAENSVDGFTAPLFYAAIFGPAGAWGYRIANTLDSMVGYKNDRYLRFGRAAARLDDLLNWIPARLTAILISLWAPVVRGRTSAGLRTMWTYAPLHASPNAGWTEAAAAGSLDLRLGGPASYFGKPVEKPYLGSSLRPPEPADIRRTRRLVLFAGLSFALITAGALLIASPAP